MAYFIESPICCSVTPHYIKGATFHRVVANISVEGNVFRQSMPVAQEKADARIEFDISSSLRAYASSLKHEVVSIKKDLVPFDFTVTFADEYMYAGVAYRLDINYTFTGKAMLGGWTDRERLDSILQSNPDQAENASMSLRPQSEWLICPADVPFIHHSTKKNQQNVIVRSCVSKFATPGNLVYIIDSSEKSKFVHFQFINSRGINESAFAFHAADSMKGESTSYVRSLREFFSVMSHRLDVKTAAFQPMSFSSGFVSLPMARWWLFEFCQAKQYWIFYDGVWMPCTVQAKDGTKILDRTKTELLSVEFDVIPGINGSPCL